MALIVDPLLSTSPPTPEGRGTGANPRLDLDSVYGLGPVASSYLYDPADPTKLRLEDGGAFEDLPRTSEMAAVIADRRTTRTW